MRPEGSAPRRATDQRHTPVLLGAFLKAAAPINGKWVDCTFGAGGYSRALIAAGAEKVFGMDCDPDALEDARTNESNREVELVQGRFSNFDQHPEIAPSIPVDGVVFDLGVSSMQVDQAERGFSFSKDGPLDMRMSRSGPTAADIVNGESERRLAEIFFRFGEDRAARRVARKVAEHRSRSPITTTAELSQIITAAKSSERAKSSIHPATKCFQALRIAVNDELGQLARGLEAAERALRKGGLIAVVTFHSLEDRIVKRFFRACSGALRSNRHRPQEPSASPSFDLMSRRPLTPDESEIALNPRSRSAKLRLARRTDAPSRFSSEAPMEKAAVQVRRAR